MNRDDEDDIVSSSLMAYLNDPDCDYPQVRSLFHEIRKRKEAVGKNAARSRLENNLEAEISRNPALLPNLEQQLADHPDLMGQIVNLTIDHPERLDKVTLHRIAHSDPGNIPGIIDKITSATEEQQRRAQEKPTIFICFIHPGGMMDKIPCRVMATLESLVGRRSAEFFHVFDAGSGGAIITSALNVRDPDNPSKPKYSARDIDRMFREIGPVLFPKIPDRALKMSVANTFNMLEDSLDPKKIDAIWLREIGQSLRTLRDIFTDRRQKVTTRIKNEGPFVQSAKDEEYRNLVAQETLLNRLADIAERQWLTKSARAAAEKICDILSKDPALEKEIGDISQCLSNRTTTGCLWRVFSKAALVGMGQVQKRWAHDYMYDPKIATDTFKNLLGEGRLSEGIRSIYIPAFDKIRGKSWIFFNRKKDLLSTDPGTPYESSRHNHKTYDALMASISNPLAYALHTTEDGGVYNDKATLHTPLNAVEDVLDGKPPNANVKLIIFGTARYRPDDMGADQLIADHNRYGFTGNMLRLQELEDVSSYTMSEVFLYIRKKLGKDNILEFVPRMSPRTKEEKLFFPHRDITDASPEQLERIDRRADAFIYNEKFEEIKSLARMIANNMRILGEMDLAEFRQTMDRIDNARPEIPQPAPEQDNRPPPSPGRVGFGPMI